MLKIVCLTLFVIGVAADVPVVLIGAEGPIRPSLPVIENEDLYNILAPLAKEHMIAVIQEENLSSHDFLCKSNRTEQSCYANLQSVSPKTFYRSVKSPEAVLETIDPEYNVLSISKSGKLETPLKCKAGKVAFLRFSEETELSRVDTLEAHDYTIANLLKQASCPTVYLYTSAPANANSVLKRSRRAVSASETAASDGGVIFSNSNFQIFWTKLSVTIGTASAKEITISSMNVVENNSTDLTITLASADGADTIKFDVALVSNYYYIKLLTYNGDTQFYTQEISAPPSFSYYCGNLTLYSTAGDELLWNSVQFQAPFGSTVTSVANSTYFEFGDSWNCVGFVTPGILAGLFVSAILLSILFVAICWMMDINTMDRFDDPKGKTITINANE